MPPESSRPNDAPLVQMHRRRYEVKRVRRGDQPVFGFDLLPHEQLVGVDHHYEVDSRHRETVDHVVWVWVAVHLESPE